MTLKTLKIELLGPQGADRALAFYAASGHAYTAPSEERLRECVGNGTWDMVIACGNDTDIGAFYLNNQPKYGFYQRLGLPELQDLRVLPGYRKQGVATSLIAYAEDMARAKDAPGIGISVGLTADYGAAQRLYAGLGYMPDGNGVTYDRIVVEKGEKRTVDDDLAIMLLKFF